jgi:hypothetical protein
MYDAMPQTSDSKYHVFSNETVLQTIPELASIRYNCFSTNDWNAIKTSRNNITCLHYAKPPLDAVLMICSMAAKIEKQK